jgi:HNH endonuclease
VVDATCVICGSPCRQEYCSDRCRNRRPRNYSEAAQERRRAYDRSRNRDTGRTRRRYRVNQRCLSCKRLFDPYSAGQEYCSRQCAQDARPKNPLSCELIYQDCEECGKLCVNRRVCSKGCLRRAQRRRDLIRYGKTPEQVDACRACGKPKPVKQGRKLCDSCREQADAEARRRARRRRKARQRGARTEPYTLAYIAKRDRYRCGLCRKRVAMTKPVPHPKAPTIDHIIPLDAGGDDVKANVQLAHFICNSMKGNRGGGEQLLLVG